MAPGSVKSPASQKVLSELEKLKTDLYDAEGNMKPASVSALINNKINLNDIVDYDVQGGAKQLLKGIIRDIDNALVEYGNFSDPQFLKNYVGANKKFASHAKTFRNQNINKILTSDDPSNLLKKMDTIQGIRDLKKAFSLSSDGKKFFKDLSRLKMDEIIEKNMVDGTNNQLKLGTFSNILDKGKNRDIIKELMSPESYNELIKLQKNTGRLYESAQKFYNASKSGTVLIDAKIFDKLVGIPFAVAGMLSGNIWLMAPYATHGAMKGAAKLFTDPKFLRTIEDLILATEKNDTKSIQRISEILSSYLVQIDQSSS
jgi:hypothetical protein